jgi:uncharacterized protein (DUF362 family)
VSRNISSPDVALHYDPRAWSYATDPPFHPQIRYPEYDGPLSRSGTPNAAYDAVRETLHLLQLDDAHYGRMDWNPLGNFVSPGQMVAIKPNLVMNRHLRGGSLDCVITHGSIIRAVVDYACLALQGRGRIVIGDAPLQMADFDAICECNGLHEIAHYAQSTWGVDVDIVDFRRVRAVSDHGHVVRVDERDGDPRGYVVVDLAEASMLAAVSEASDRFRVPCYDADAVGQHHNEHKNEYLVSGSILQTNCVISISKLKTHRKAGMTAALKNLVGINGHKDWLPHHRCGAAKERGDEYLNASASKRLSTRLAEQALQSRAELRRAWGTLSVAAGAAAKRLGRDPYTEGSWYGNDTLWRTVLDLNRVLLYADREGILRPEVQRNCLHLVDAVIAGEGEGPLEPNTKVCGMMLGGLSPVAVDTVVAGMMGFDFRKIPTVFQGYGVREFPLADFAPEDVRVHSNQAEFDGLDALAPEPSFHFRPTAGWRGHIERDEVEAFVLQQ